MPLSCTLISRNGTAVGPSVLHRPALYAKFPKSPTGPRLVSAGASPGACRPGTLRILSPMSDLSKPDAPGRPADGGSRVPAWRRRTRGEHRWPSILAVTGVIVVQLLLPDRLILHPRWLLPGIEIALAVALVVANP